MNGFYVMVNWTLNWLIKLFRIEATTRGNSAKWDALENFSKLTENDLCRGQPTTLLKRDSDEGVLP